MDNEQSIEAEEQQLLELHERALADPEGEEARIVRLAEVLALRTSTNLASALAEVQQRMEESS